MSKSPQVLAIIGQKGGGGKTTTAIGLAVEAVERGLTTVVVDLDPQTNAANWKDRREADSPAVVATPPGRLKQTLQTAIAHGADFIIIDTPGKADSLAVEAARVADLILIPIEAQMFHLETLPALRDLIRVAGDKPAFVLLNGLHPLATTQAEEAKKMVAETYPFAVCPVHLSQFDAFATSANIGLTPREQDPKGKAAGQLKMLYKFISEQLDKSQSPQANKSESKHVENAKLATGT
jgi:chromosome partitioning protein